MNYGMISIDYGSVNLGNRLIEFAVKKLLLLPKPYVTISMFKFPTDREIAQLNKCDFILVPGSTVLAKAPGNSDALAALNRMNPPKFCIAASGWKPRYHYYTEAMQQLTPPIGCRDPKTLNICKSLNIPAILTGCPTAYLNKLTIEKPKVPFSIIGFGRKNTDLQLALFHKLRGKYIAAIQEKKFAMPLIKKLKIQHFTYEDVQSVMQWYAKASFVLTGRLHGVLPALSQHKKVMFFGNPKDSRFSLLEYLGIKVTPITSKMYPTFIDSNTYIDQLDKLKQNFLSWGKQVGIN
jgi:polysaccharide pyruvyl transferase WcaK-like protein